MLHRKKFRSELPFRNTRKIGKTRQEKTNG